MSEPNEAILPAVRCQMEQAEEKVRIAVRLFRDNGWTENADDLMRCLRFVQTWTQKPGGWLEYLEK